jgi:hypothetical protein
MVRWKSPDDIIKMIALPRVKFKRKEKLQDSKGKKKSMDIKKKIMIASRDCKTLLICPGPFK